VVSFAAIDGSVKANAKVKQIAVSYYDNRCSSYKADPRGSTMIIGAQVTRLQRLPQSAQLQLAFYSEVIC
jgi:hypothetical protein